MNKVKNIIAKCIYFVGCTILVAMILTVLLQIVARFLLKVSIPWTEELSRLLFIGMVCFGAVIASMKGTHIVVDTFSTKIPAKYRKAYQVAIDFSVLIVSLVFLLGTVKMIPTAHRTFYSTMPHVRNSWPYYFTTFAFSMISLNQIVNIISRLITKEK